MTGTITCCNTTLSYAIATEHVCNGLPCVQWLTMLENTLLESLVGGVRDDFGSG